MLTQGLLLQGRYKIVRLLNKGGRGAVYEAIDGRFGNKVAVKETFFSSNSILRNQFEREARLLNSLRHSALPLVTDHFVEDDGQFLVMEFIPGDNLKELLTDVAQ